MRVGILTYHRSINNGAVMQCYSLAKRLCMEFPEDHVEVIDYHMPKIEKHYEVSLCNFLQGKTAIQTGKRLIKLMLSPDTLLWQRKRKKAFEGVIHNLPLSPYTILDDHEEALFSYIEEKYDIVIAGSDAIWNYNLRGFPNPYFLSERINCYKVSYAASCYGMNYEDLPPEQIIRIREILNTYSFLGVRDDESSKFVNAIGCKRECVHTCDPTVFLNVDDLPIDVEALHKKLLKKGFSFSKESIGVMGTEDMCKMVRSFYGDKYQIVALYERCNNADINLFDLSPYEWAYVFRFFRLTFTTYFHGTLLSLRNGTPVICIALENKYSQRHMTKVEDFLIRIGLESCYFHTDYRTTNLECIKRKADCLLKANLRKMLTTKMDTEAATFNSFLDAMREFKKSIMEPQ